MGNLSDDTSFLFNFWDTFRCNFELDRHNYAISRSIVVVYRPRNGVIMAIEVEIASNCIRKIRQQKKVGTRVIGQISNFFYSDSNYFRSSIISNIFFETILRNKKTFPYKNGFFSQNRRLFQKNPWSLRIDTLRDRFLEGLRMSQWIF